MKRRVAPVLGVALLFLVALATAAPLPVPRTRPLPGSMPRLDVAPLAAERDAVAQSPCGTGIDRMPEFLAQWAERPQPLPLATSYSGDTDNLAVLEDDGTFFYTNLNNQPLLDIAAVTRAFYRGHPDQYDAIAIYLASGQTQWLGSPGALAAAWLVRNDTDGIGLARFDYGAALGSPPGLRIVLTMNGLQRYPSDLDAPIGGDGDTFSTMDVLAHEFAHRWLAYTFVDSAGTESPALLGRDQQHWNFFADVDGSYMEGCEWAQVGPDSFRTTEVSERFGVLDQYLMGLRTRAEIDSFIVVNAPTDFTPPGTYIPITTPFVGLGCDGRATAWRIPDIEAVHGPRVPDGAVSPRGFRVAFVLVTPRGTPATAADLGKLGAIRQRFPLTLNAGTDGRASVDCTLEALPATISLTHAPLRDSESGGSPRPLGVSARVLRGAAGASVTRIELSWREGDSGPFTLIALAAAGQDSFAGSAPALSTGDAQYYLQAYDDVAGTMETLPRAGAAEPFRYHIGPDLTPPLLRHTPVQAQSRDRLPQGLLARVDDALGVDSVWCEYRIGPGALQILGATHAGGDSFTVAIGAGATTGERIAYRFVARDRAVAANLAYSAVGFDTMRVVHDWVDDFENPTPFFHYNVLYSWRDAWHVEPGASSPDGEFAWHCGSQDGTPYGAHEDAALYSPLIPGVGPGVTLSFDHRYDLESLDGTSAWDGARVEISVNNGAWQVANPVGGYSHSMLSANMPFARNSPCWSGRSLAWRTETIDLGGYGPGSVRMRFRMCADDFVGGQGWWVDRLRVHFPDNETVGVPLQGDAMAVGGAWPNPAHERLNQSLRLPRGADVLWTLHDVLGRRVRVLASAHLGAGAHELGADLPRGLAGGIYFARLNLGGSVVASQRVAILE
ncbi:MAG: hypothetical protein ABIU54_12000 [Candidatus Eisenbacteria bacterium]